MPPETVVSSTAAAGTTGAPTSIPASAPSQVGDVPTSSTSTQAPDASVSPAASPPVEAPPVIEGAKEPEFDWDKWDGDDFDALPEPHREPARKIRARYDDRFKDLDERDLTLREKEQELSRTAHLYDSILSGDPDPRIAEAEAKHAEIERQWLEAQAKFGDERKAWTQKESEWKAWQKEQADRYVSEFKQRHPELDADAELRKGFTALLKDGWDPEMAVEVARQPEDVRAEILRLRKDEGFPEKGAIEHATLRAASRKQTPAPPRPGSQITSGSAGSVQQPAHEKDMATAKTFVQRRAAAIANNLHRTRKAG